MPEFRTICRSRGLTTAAAGSRGVDLAECLAVTFYCIKRIKGHPYLYRQTNYRIGGRVVSDSVYIGPAAGAIPYGSAPRSLDPADGSQRRRVEEKISRSLSITAERLAREKARRLRSVRFELDALRHLETDQRLWRKL